MTLSLRPPVGPLVLIAGLTAALAVAAVETTEKQTVQFIVIVPDIEPEQVAHIFLASSADDWKPNGRKIPRVAPGLYAASFEFAAGTRVEYKFTRVGSWATVEKSPDGAELDNRIVTASPDLAEQVCVDVVDRWADRPPNQHRQVNAGARAHVAGAAPTEAPVATKLTGDVRYHHAFASPQLDNQRTLMVWLPPSYTDEERRFPVLYMHDGNNLFDARTSFTKVEWGVDETATALIKAGKIDELIIVGIYNTPQRADEYTPWKDAERDAGGNADAYLDFVVNTVKPFIDERYRTKPDREHTAIAGSSLGGLVSLYAVHEHPDVFSKAGVISPALWWADSKMLDYVQSHTLAHKPRLWIDVGTKEGDVPEGATMTPYVRDCRKLVEILKQHGYTPGKDFRYLEVDGGVHHESAWAERFDQVLLFLFGK